MLILPQVRVVMTLGEDDGTTAWAILVGGAKGAGMGRNKPSRDRQKASLVVVVVVQAQEQYYGSAIDGLRGSRMGRIRRGD